MAKAGSISVVNLTNEQFMVPEILFRPTDIGMQQGGIAEMIREVLMEKVPATFQNLCYKNIITAGGNTKIPGFIDRLRYEVDNCGNLNDMVANSGIFDAESNCDPSNPMYSEAAIKGL